MVYEYLIGASIFAAPWLILFWLRKDLHKKMLWSSIAAMFTVGFGFLFVPEYWSPNTLFDLAPLEIEGFILMFFVGGISSVLYTMLFMKKEAKDRKRHPLHYLILLVMPLSFLLTKSLLDFNVAYHFSIALLAGAIGISIIRKDLFKESFFGGLAFAVVYFVLFEIIILIFPDFVGYWNLSNLSQIFILGTPIEELLMAFTFGALWAPLYEDIRNYRLKRLG